MSKRTMGLDDMLCFALYSASHAMGRVYQPLLEALGVTYPQYLVLIALWADDDQTVGQLGQQLFLESNTLTPLLKRMEAQGLIARRRDDDDERVVRVKLTAAGRGLQQRAKEVPRCVLEASSLSMPAAVELRDAIAGLRDALVRSASADAG